MIVAVPSFVLSTRGFAFGRRLWARRRRLPVGSARSLGLVTAVVGIIVASGCRSSEPDPATAASSPMFASSSDTSKPGTEAQPTVPSLRRVASRLVLGDEMLWAGGESTRPLTVAVSGLADDPRYSAVAGRWPDTVTRLGKNPEQLLALAPDLVLLADFTDVEYRNAIAPHLTALEFDSFSGFAAYRTAVSKLSTALGRPQFGARLLAAFDERHAAIAAETTRLAAADSSRRPTCLVWQFDSTAGADTTFHDAAELAGCRNRAAMAEVSGHRRVDVEEMLSWDPDFVVLSCGEAGCEMAMAQFGERPGVRQLSAVAAGRLIAIEPPYLSTTGFGMLELAAQIQRGVYGANPLPPAPVDASG